MLSVGLTGGIGAGKSLCSRIFEVLGVPVYISDVAAKRLMAENAKVKKAIIDAFGPGCYSVDGLLNRHFLANLIFNNDKNLETINSIVHPAVRLDFLQWGIQNNKSSYIIQESALIFEGGLEEYFNKVILVIAPKELRIQRVVNRDNISREQVLARMSKQLSQKEKIKKADFIIRNDGTDSIIKQVINIHLQLLEISKKEE